MKHHGKSGRPGKRRRNMPGYHLGVNRIGHKAWFVNRRPEDIAGHFSKRDFLDGKIKPGTIFAVSKKSNVIFLGIHRGRILYYNPKTDRVAHTGLGRGDQNAARIAVLKEKAGLDYFKSENNWMNHRKIPGSDLKVSDVLLNPYRKTIIKNVGDEFTMLDYHESAVVGDILHGHDSGLKAEVTGITKRGIWVRVDDGSPDGREGFINLKKPAFKTRKYSLVKSAVNDDLQVEDLQKKIQKGSYDIVHTETGGSVAVRRGRPEGSTNRPLTDEEKQAHRDKANKHIEELNNVADEDINGQLGLVKKIISHSNKAGDEETNNKYKRVRQQLNYKVGLHDAYDKAETPEDKLEAAKSALKYERRIGGKDSAINMWQNRINSLKGDNKNTQGKEEPSKKNIEQEKTFEEKISKEFEENSKNPVFIRTYEAAKREYENREDKEELIKKLNNFEHNLKNNTIFDNQMPSRVRIATLAVYKVIKERIDELNKEKSFEEKTSREIEKHSKDPEFTRLYKNAKKMYAHRAESEEELLSSINLFRNELETNKHSTYNRPLTSRDRLDVLARYKALNEYSNALRNKKEFEDTVARETEKYKDDNSFNNIYATAVGNFKDKDIEYVQNTLKEVQGRLKSLESTQVPLLRKADLAFNKALKEVLSKKEEEKSFEDAIEKETEEYKKLGDYRYDEGVYNARNNTFNNKNLDEVKNKLNEIRNMLKTNKDQELEELSVSKRRRLLVLYKTGKEILQDKLFEKSLEDEISKEQRNSRFINHYNWYNEDVAFQINSLKKQNYSNQQIKEKLKKDLNQLIDTWKKALKTNKWWTGEELSPEDRLMNLAFYKAGKEKLNELNSDNEKLLNDNKSDDNNQQENLNENDIEKNNKFKGYKRLKASDLNSRQIGDKFFVYDTSSNKILEVNIEENSAGAKVYRTPVFEKGVPTDKAASLIQLTKPFSQGINSQFVALDKADDSEHHPQKWHSLAVGDLVHVSKEGVNEIYKVFRNDENGTPILEPLKYTSSIPYTLTEIRVNQLNDNEYDLIHAPSSSTSAINLVRNLSDQTHLVAHTEKGNLALRIHNYELKYDTDKKSLNVSFDLEDSDHEIHKIEINNDKVSKNNIFDENTSISSMNLSLGGDEEIYAPGTPMKEMQTYGIEKSMSHLCIPGMNNNISLKLNQFGFEYRNTPKINNTDAGLIVRDCSKDGQKWKIYNSYFRLPPLLRGDSIAQRFYDNQVMLSKKLNIKYFKMQCSLTVGGYAWATKKKGFDFYDRSADGYSYDAQRYKGYIINKVEGMTLNDWKLFHPTATEEIMNNHKKTILAELNKTLKDANGNAITDSYGYERKYWDYAKAHEFAEFTYKYDDENGNKITVGAKRQPDSDGNRDDRLHHLGKAIMLGTGWDGVKHIDTDQYNTPEWDISRIEAPNPKVYNPELARQ